MGVPLASQGSYHGWGCSHLSSPKLGHPFRDFGACLHLLLASHPMPMPVAHIPGMTPLNMSTLCAFAWVFMCMGMWGT